MYAQDKFKQVFECPGIKLFVPINTTDYHMSRYIESSKHAKFSSIGITPELLKRHLDAIIDVCNVTAEQKTLRTDIGALANAIKMRMEYPVDDLCAIRIGISLTFAQITDSSGNIITEDPNKVEYYWMKRKEELAIDNPDLYAFFLGMGMSSLGKSIEHLNISDDMAFLMEKAARMREVYPDGLKHLLR